MYIEREIIHHRNTNNHLRVRPLVLHVVDELAGEVLPALVVFRTPPSLSLLLLLL